MRHREGLLLSFLVAVVFASACSSTPAPAEDAGVDSSQTLSDATTDDGSCEDPDGDGDGIDSVACGGNDCDDDDATRFPGNTEVCDVDHVDEDCDPSTLGGSDVDGDEFVDAACCNPDDRGDLVCGDDCNDLRPDVNPSATEACDQTDNNCDGRMDEGFDPSTCWPPCMPGTIQTAPPSASAPPTCTVCEPGAYCPGGLAMRQPCVTTDWDHDADAGTVCVSRTGCVAGQFVASEGDATHNRTCSNCAEGSYSTAPNAAVCSPWLVTCSLGQYMLIPGTRTSDRVCQGCAAGHFSAVTNAESCTEWRDCAAGTSATTPNLMMDRVCTDCAPGFFTAGTNVASCNTHAVCPLGQFETTAGTAAQNRQCTPVASGASWIRQFGTDQDDDARGFAVSSSGDVFVAGFTGGTLAGQTSSGSRDAYLRKYDADGAHLWTRQFGTSAFESVNGAAVDSAGNVYVAGHTSEAFPGQTVEGSTDAFIRKYDPAGNVLWTRQFGTPQLDQLNDVIVDADDHVIATGSTGGALPTRTLVGVSDVFIVEYDSGGTRLWVQQHGVAGATVVGQRVVADASGNLFVAGRVTGGAFAGQTDAGNGDVFLMRCDADGDVVWTRQFGSSVGESASALARGADGSLFVAGSTSGTLPGQTSSGDTDGWLRAYDPDGTARWTRQFGTNQADQATAVTVRSDGVIYLFGFTMGSFTGHTGAGFQDVLISRYSNSGVLLGSRQFGTSNVDIPRGATFVGNDLLLAGLAAGPLPGQTAAGMSDAFVMRMLPW